MVRRLIVALLASLLLATTVACDDQANPSTIPDGSTRITKAMRGIWNAPGGSTCRWWIVNRSGTITNNGNLRQKLPARHQSQTVVIGTGNVGETFKSDNCAPKGWTK